MQTMWTISPYLTHSTHTHMCRFIQRKLFARNNNSVFNVLNAWVFAVGKSSTLVAVNPDVYSWSSSITHPTYPTMELVSTHKLCNKHAMLVYHPHTFKCVYARSDGVCVCLFKVIAIILSSYLLLGAQPLLCADVQIPRSVVSAFVSSLVRSSSTICLYVPMRLP